MESHDPAEAELDSLLKEDIRTSKEVLDEEMHRHIKSRTGFLLINCEFE